MGVTNIMRNRKCFMKEVLDVNGGERIELGSVDGEVMVVDEYEAMSAIDAKLKLKTYPMSLFPTNRRIVAYQARNGIRRDRFAQLPYTSISRIVFNVEVPDKKKRKRGKELTCVTTFVSPDESEFPTIMFRYDIADLYAFNAYRRVILPQICKMSRVRLTDMTDYSMLQDTGINQKLLDNSKAERTADANRRSKLKDEDNPDLMTPDEIDAMVAQERQKRAEARGGGNNAPRRDGSAGQQPQRRRGGGNGGGSTQNGAPPRRRR